MTEKPAASAEPTGWLKIALEMGPLIVFFLAFRYGEEIAGLQPIGGWLDALLGESAMDGDTAPLFVATAVFMVAIAVSLAVSWSIARSLPKMAVLTGIVVAVFGTLTLVLQDETFIKMKPTVVNSLFALILGVGLLQGRSYLKYLLGEAMPLDDAGWMIFTRRWMWFFLFLAALNEVVWRTQSDAFWVSFKTFGNLPLTIGFMAAQIPLLKRHLVEEEATGAGTPPS